MPMVQLLSPSYLVFLGAMLAAYGAFRMSDKPGRGIVLFGALLAALGAFLSASKEARFYKELMSTVTGGDSYCYITFPKQEANTNSPHIAVVHSGRYPLYDVQIQIVDLDEWQSRKGQVTMDVLPLTRETISLGTLVPKVTTLRKERLKLPDDEDRRGFNIFMTARNGVFLQTLTLRRVNGLWKRAIKVFRELGDRQIVLLEKKDDGYPQE